MKAQLLLLLVIASVFTQTLDNLPGVPEDLIDNAQNALKAAVPQLQRFSARKYSKTTLYHAIKNVVDALNAIKQVLGKNNAIVGDNNALAGDNNVIIGSDNVVQGDDNWLIQTNEFQGQIDQTLIYKDWAIRINRVQLIKVNPRFVIQLINPQDRVKYRHFFKNFEGKGHNRRSKGWQVFFGKLKHQEQPATAKKQNQNPNAKKKQQQVFKWEGFHVRSYCRDKQCQGQKQNSYREKIECVPQTSSSLFPFHPDHANLKLNQKDSNCKNDEVTTETTTEQQVQSQETKRTAKHQPQKKIPKMSQFHLQKSTKASQKTQKSPKQANYQINIPRVSPIKACQVKNGQNQLQNNIKVMIPSCFHGN